MSEDAEWPVDSRFLARLRVRLVDYSSYRGVKEHSEDVADEAIQVLWQRYRAVTDEAEITKLAFTICRFKILEKIRIRRRSEPLPDDLPLADSRLRIDQTMEEDECLRVRQQRLRTALAQLGKACQQLFKLRFLKRTTKDIATIMGATENAILVREHRCRKQLLAQIELLGGMS